MSPPGSTSNTIAANVLPLTHPTLHYIMPLAPSSYLHPLNVALARYHINTGKRVAAFLAQIAVESKQLTHVRESWTARKDFNPGVKSRPGGYTATSAEDYFGHWYGNRPGLGNETVEDGYTYRGRGAIQITGKKNYIDIGTAIGQPLEENPDLLATDKTVDMLASAYHFARLNHLNHVADQVDPDSPASIVHINTLLTKGVNGGYNGLSERLEFYKKALANFRSLITP